MSTKEINKIINKLYRIVQKSGYSGKLYRDDDWSGLYSIREIVQPVLPPGFRLIMNHVYGYTQDGNSKEYQFTVEHEETGEQIIDGYITAHAAGNMNDKWSAYDITAQWAKHNNTYTEANNIKKKLVRLTEADLHRIVNKSVKRVINEIYNENNEKFGYTKDFILYGNDDRFIRFDTKYGRFAIKNSPDSPWLYSERYNYSIPFNAPIKYNNRNNEIPIEELIKISEKLFEKQIEYDKRQKQIDNEDSDNFWLGWE